MHDFLFSVSTLLCYTSTSNIKKLNFRCTKKYVYYYFKGKEYYHYEFTKTILAYIA